jgi:hypothetical protein
MVSCGLRWSVVGLAELRKSQVNDYLLIGRLGVHSSHSNSTHQSLAHVLEIIRQFPSQVSDDGQP